MPDEYEQLLDATVQHLEKLKARGVRFVSVSPETLAGLNKTIQAPFSKPTPAPCAAPPASPPRPVAPTAPPRTAPPIEQKPAVEVSFGLNVPGETVMQPARSLSPEAKAAAFAELRQRAMACVKCSHLASSRKNVVFGVGSIDAELMFVGEAPGADEDEQGEPFVGKAGQLLTKNHPDNGPAPRRRLHRQHFEMPAGHAGPEPPATASRPPEEMQTCIPFLHEQIDLIRPKVLVALGATAVEGLLGKTAGITRLRGHWQTYRGMPLMPTYHPAYLLRNQAMSEKRRVWEDMLQVMEKLGMPISEKQRNFFLKRNG